MALEHVTSADGTTIAYSRTGTGPPLLLVHGSLNDRNAWAFVTPAFAERFTVFAMDRRGRGESGPVAEHALEREFEDVIALIDAIGEPVDLAGHSFGARCAIGATAMVPDRVKHLVLYEPPSSDQAEGLPEIFEALSPDDAVTTFFRRMDQPEAEIEARKATPAWPYLLGFTSTMPSEMRTLRDHRFDPERHDALTMPVLLLKGSESTPRLGVVMRQLQQHIPRAKWVTLEGQGHGAIMLAPKLFSDTVLAFLAE